MSSEPRLLVSVSNTTGQRTGARGLGAWLARVAPAEARGSVSIALVGDHAVRALNRRFRGIDRATDVLSFPSASGPPAAVQADGESFLGDIVIAKGVADRQAEAAGHSSTVELRVLALHGLLHLIGYDHESDDGTMARLEQRLRRKGGLPGGLIERAG